MGLLDDNTYKVSVLRQKMLGMHPVFTYRIPKEKAFGEEYLCVVVSTSAAVLVRCSVVSHYLTSSADEWNLRKPLQECSLRIERRGDLLLVVFTYKKEGSPPSLFAVCKIDIELYDMSHYVQAVGDSSRFFAIRVTDEKGGREAVVGLGFRERDEAADFSQCLINFQNALARERLDRANAMATQ